MPANDQVLEMLREMRGDFGLVTTELGRLARQAEYTNIRLDEHGRLLHRLDERVGSVERDLGAVVTAVGLLHASVQAIIPALTEGRGRDDRLVTRVDECERRLDVLEDERR